MKSNHANPSPSLPSSPKDGTKRALLSEDLRLGLLSRAVVAGGILLLAIGISLMVSSCGSGDAQDNATVALQTLPTTSVATTASMTPERGTLPVASIPDSGSLPPDVDVAAIDSVVAPGSKVVIVAEATVDASQIVLWDGLHDRQPFVYDLDGKVWTTTYRVPLRPTSDRIALSVTAKNDLDRWRRVWVFLKVQRSGEGVESQADCMHDDPSDPVTPE